MLLLTPKISGCHNKATIIFTAFQLVCSCLAIHVLLLRPIGILASASASDSCQTADGPGSDSTSERLFH